jgi:hypothetical protein
MRVSGYNIVTRHRSRKLNKYLYKHFYIFLFWLNKESCFKRGKNERRVHALFLADSKQIDIVKYRLFPTVLVHKVFM